MYHAPTQWWDYTLTLDLITMATIIHYNNYLEHRKYSIAFTAFHKSILNT